MHVRTCADAGVPPFSVSRNGWTNYAEIWYVVGDPLPRFFLQTLGVDIAERAHLRTPFLHLENGWARRWVDCAENWYVVRDPFARRFTEVNDGVQVHVRCALPSPVPGTSGQIALKFGVWLWYYYLYVLHRMGDICTKAHVA